ncbi:hypothetical protein M514_06205 [Trichuris suis]|uniref:Uncharacterized protein n=1 Tax=Trichuris suis TaxID=68888 RepID=A0A085N2L2_9BILA|nr:hypothetical protein M513_06205 [Trichuris suis]KFD63708.1 hypothetical protein M514_06205 [Trichuris suis]
MQRRLEENLRKFALPTAAADVQMEATIMTTCIRVWSTRFRNSHENDDNDCVAWHTQHVYSTRLSMRALLLRAVGRFAAVVLWLHRSRAQHEIRQQTAELPRQETPFSNFIGPLNRPMKIAQPQPVKNRFADFGLSISVLSPGRNARRARSSDQSNP